MFDNIKFSLADCEREYDPTDLTQFTALGLLNILFFKGLITRDNAYDICEWLAHAEPRKIYNAGTFCIIALDY